MKTVKGLKIPWEREYRILGNGSLTSHKVWTVLNWATLASWLPLVLGSQQTTQQLVWITISSLGPLLWL